MLAWLISSGVRLRTLVVVVAAGLLILGVVDIKNKPLDVIPELALPSLTVKTESLGLSSAEVESQITMPLEADLLNSVPWLRVIQPEWMAGLSTIEMIFVPGTDLMKTRQMVQPARVEVTLEAKIEKVTVTAKEAERLGILIDDVRTDASGRRIVTYASVLYDLTGTTWVCISADPLTFVRGAAEIDALKAITCT
jgi:multidrug efflux pump subunit AcrB